MRTFRGIAAIFLVVALAFGAAGCNSDKGIVARVNGEEVTQEQFDRYYEQVVTQMGGDLDEETAIEYKRQLLDLLIESMLVTQEAEKQGADLSEEAVSAGISELSGGATDMAVIETSPDGLILRETAPGVTVEQVVAATEARLTIPANVPEMAIA